MPTLQNHDYSITFACFNQLEYTKRCVQSLIDTGTDLGRLVVVDNLSSDGTQDYLRSLPLGTVIYNKQNFGCGVAWNQGALALQTEWTIVMNNDVVVAPGWLDGLIECARSHQLKVVSPAMIEGELDYDLSTFAAEASQKLGARARYGQPHAVCMAIHASVWQAVGFFRATPKLLGYEDGIFFAALRRESLATGTVSSAWIHHFGSVTQKALKLERGLKSSQGLGDRFHPELGRQAWLSRKLNKMKRRAQQEAYREEELAHAGLTMHGERANGAFRWI